MYEMGHGIPRSDETAIQWYRRAARGGNGMAQTNLGIMYIRGIGCRKNASGGIAWLQKAAAQNAPNALYNLAVAHMRGDGVPRAVRTAKRYARMAAKLGDQKAVRFLASY
jgi:TPR repeat protein